MFSLTGFVIISAVGEPALIIALEVFLLEAKAFWGQTCIAGGLFFSNTAAPIRTPLRSVLMSRCRAIHPVRNLAACEQAPNSQFRPVCAPLVEPRIYKGPADDVRPPGLSQDH